ncbi:unnamed protein product [Oikopleura dioica]|uniref:Uncharacterized protein n=1 Tax=Oikopleura dioica TaxID=34765 RepID=E4YZR9_OIKDI|nr:unnamed protein product [Oikopleura dioica]
MSDSSFSEIEHKKTTEDKIELKCVLPDGISIHREYSVTETLKDVLDDIWDSGVEDEIWEEYIIEVDELCSSDEEPDPEELESSESESESEKEDPQSDLHDEEVHPVLNSMFNPYHNTLATLTGRPYVPSSPVPPPSPVNEKEKLLRRVKKADIRLRAVTKSNFKIKEFKNDDMQLQIQSLDLFENLLRVSFAETNDENNDREAQESTINQIIGNKQMADYNRYVVDFEEDIEEEKTLCERLNDPYYSLNMMRQHLHFFCEKEKRKVRLREDDNKNPLCGWNRDFGARKVQNVIQAQYFTRSWCNQKDNEQTYVNARIYLRHWSEDMPYEEAKLSFELTIKFSRFVGTPEERPTNVLDLLEDVNKSPFYKRNVELQRYLPVRNGLDFFIVAGKMEILLPLTEKVRNFTSIQNGKFEQVDLFLCRGLDRMVPSYFPWNPGNMYNDNLTTDDIVLDVPYEKSILQKSKLSKYKHALAMRIMTTQDIPYNVAHEVFYKVAVITGRKVLASQLDQNFGQTTLASFLKPYFRFKNLIFADLPQEIRIHNFLLLTIYK